MKIIVQLIPLPGVRDLFLVVDIIRLLLHVTINIDTIYLKEFKQDIIDTFKI